MTSNCHLAVPKYGPTSGTRIVFHLELFVKKMNLALTFKKDLVKQKGFEILIVMLGRYRLLSFKIVVDCDVVRTRCYHIKFVPPSIAWCFVQIVLPRKTCIQFLSGLSIFKMPCNKGRVDATRSRCNSEKFAFAFTIDMLFEERKGHEKMRV